jgi:hypothetical protein
MKPFVLITLLGLASLTLGCNTRKSTTDIGTAADSGATIHTPVPADSTTCRALSKTDPGTSNSIASLEGKIEGTCLALTVRYSGGCEAHDFQLHWDGTILESYPAQVHMVLVHSGKRDGCQRMVTETLRFELGSLLDPKGGPLDIGISAEGAPGIGILFTPK